MLLTNYLYRILELIYLQIVNHILYKSVLIYYEHILIT